MKQLIGLLFLTMFIACNNNGTVTHKIVGKWKIYQTKIDQRDISKSSDPTYENGLEFKENGVYISFGNPGHHDQGTYKIDDKKLVLKSEQGQNSTNATINLTNDSLQLDIALDSLRTLYMGLYRIKEN